ncbi:membrane glycosyltransferase [Fontimonas thermophila]|uniref:Glucans biosynthesis glucosyltransferase H n=1 Tax=Fontimonas thermophila TaxID=1076937 RepID=A0A1I2KL51_9GAMM|nr:glucans biosynthesis glucosyltransferase MdoH [Fontimonas thermophila]SFF65666.1 membrane glycosyltransferase [Fontimonas thermophila]
MDSTTRGAAERLSRYLQRLSLDAATRTCVEMRLSGAADAPPREVFASVHEALSGRSETSAVDAVRHSAWPRLRTRLLAQPRKGDRNLDSIIAQDRHGDLRLVTTPPLVRASMSPRPWDNNPLRRLWRWLAAQLLGRRGRMHTRATQQESPPRRPAPWRVAARNRRLLLIALVLVQTYFATYFMTAVLPYRGQHGLELALLAIYAVLFAWISAGFWTALMGFFQLLRGRDRHTISATTADDVPIPESVRTAILFPICNENVARVFAGIRATWDSVCRAGMREHFDLYILSDSYDADTRVAELDAWLKLCREVDGFGRIFYRRRTHRIKRKSGNIADWCRRWGSRYKYMVIFDADSVMSGACLKRLVQLMEAHDNAGIIQTAPRAAGRETLYARIQQFATRVYGPLFTAGLHFWQLGESHYWGHNAIIRVAPFMKHCALGRLPGHGALSGEIMSHDFVEAALMRRAGWAVWIAYDLPGSWEEMPPTLLDELQRDQRWCQGNLMNFRLFFSQGLHPAHRAVFMTGVMAYLSAPLWFAFLVLSTALLAVFELSEPVYFSQPYQLFPNWPSWHPEWAIRLFGGTMLLLFLPKVLSLLLALCQPAQWRGFGGPLKLALGVFLESLFSALLAPIRMLFHTRYVLSALAGFAVRWKSPPREDAQTPWSQALLRHGGGTVLGLAWLGLVYWLNPSFLWWLLPVAGSLVIAIPLSVWSSRVGLGRMARAARLFLIPEESMPPRELRWLRAALRRAAPSPGFRDAIIEPAVNALMMLSARRRPLQSAGQHAERERLADALVRDPPSGIDPRTCNRLLSDTDMLAELHVRAWSSPETHPDWLASSSS